MTEKEEKETEKSFEMKVIKEMLISVLLIISGIIMLYFRGNGLIIPGVIVTIIGISGFLIILQLNISRINEYQENNNFHQ